MKTIDFSLLWQRLATILAVITLSLALLAGLTGILLGFYYEPTAGGAHDSLQRISYLISGGAIVRSLHDIAGNGIIGVSLLELVVLFLGRQFRVGWLTAWISGILLTLTTIGLSWTAIILDWNQIGYWRFKLEMGMVESIPLVGSSLRDILTGGSISSVTLQHMYTLHGYVLSALAIGLALVHLGAQWLTAPARLPNPNPESPIAQTDTLPPSTSG